MVRTRRTWIQETLKEERILEAKIVDHMAVDRPRVGQRNLAVVNRVVLVEYCLGRIDREDELLLVKRKTCAELVSSHRVVRVDLGVLLSLKHATDYRDVAQRDVRCASGC